MEPEKAVLRLQNMVRVVTWLSYINSSINLPVEIVEDKHSQEDNVRVEFSNVLTTSVQ